MAIILENIVPWGRSLDEYVRMFSLSPNDLKKQILGCGDGPASFNAEMQAAGYQVTSLDPIYRFSVEKIRGRIDETFRTIIDQLERSCDEYLWDDIAGPEELGRMRMASMSRFLADFPTGKMQGRYIEGELPGLPFPDDRFEVALCSHLLFLYSEQLDLDFHRSAIEELCRVAREVRIFPLVTLAGHPSPHVTDIRNHLASREYRVTIEMVPYEFQRGGNTMMRIISP